MESKNVENINARFLMVEERDKGKTVFNQPAGHLEAGETLFEAAIRETREETGWQVELTGFLGTYYYLAPNNGVTYLRHCFIADALRHFPQEPLDDGIIGAHWLSVEDIMHPEFNARSPIVRKVLDDYLTGVRYPLSVIYHHPVPSQ